jgi:hypothetical protein
MAGTQKGQSAELFLRRIATFHAGAEFSLRRDSLVATLRETASIRLVQTNQIKNPPRYEDISGQEILSSIPSGRRVLTVLLCMSVALSVALLLLRYL